MANNCGLVTEPVHLEESWIKLYATYDGERRDVSIVLSATMASLPATTAVSAEVCLFVRIDKCDFTEWDPKCYCLVTQLGRQSTCRTDISYQPSNTPSFGNNVAVFPLPLDMQKTWNQSLHIGLCTTERKRTQGSSSQPFVPNEWARCSFPLAVSHFV